MVVGIGPGYADCAACAGLGASLGGNLLAGSDIRAAGHIPGPGQGRGIRRFGVHGNSRRCAYRQEPAGIPVSKALGRVGAACVNFQVLELYSLVAAAAFGLYRALIVAFRFRVAEANGGKQAYARIADDGPAAGIVLGNEGQIGSCRGFLFSLGSTVGICLLHFLFRCLVGFRAHIDAGRSLGDGLGLVGRHPGSDSHTGTVGLGMGHVRPFFADDRLGQYCVANQLVTVRYVYLSCGIGLCIALHNGNADQGHACAAGFRLHHRRIDGFYPDGVRSKGVGRGFGFLAGICIFCGSAAGFYRNGRGAFIIGFGRVHHYSAPAYAYAGGLGRYPAGPLCLQSNGSRNLFCCFLPVASRYLPGLIGLRL